MRVVDLITAPLLIVGAAACGAGDAPAATPSLDAFTPGPAQPPDETTQQTTSPPTVGPAATSTPASEPTTAGGAVWFGDHLAVGECWNDTLDAEGDFVYTGSPEEVECSEPHDNETFLVATIESADGSFPGNDAIDDFSDQQCDAGFVDYVGADSDDTALRWFSLWPGTEAWEQGARNLVCSVYLYAPALPSSGAPIVGSVQGVGANIVPASLPEGVPIPAGAVFDDLARSEDGSYVASFEFPGSVDEALAATVTAFEQQDAWQIASSTGTGDTRVLRISGAGLTTTITIHAFSDGVEWWLYYPAPGEN